MDLEVAKVDREVAKVDLAVAKVDLEVAKVDLELYQTKHSSGEFRDKNSWLQTMRTIRLCFWLKIG